MQLCYFIITDSGGIQEESAFLGKPTIVIRESTERNELLNCGNMILIGPEPERLYDEMLSLWTNSSYYKKYSTINYAYGTGNASSLIVRGIIQWTEKTSLVKLDA
jgi:UDP-N-acetylglucosamine 2-epimerase (non-hydrolysing)